MGNCSACCNRDSRAEGLSRFDPADPAEVQTPPKLIGNSGSGDDRYTFEAAAEEILHNAENHVADANENVSESFVCELSVIREEDEENVKEPLVGQKKDEEKVKEPTNGKKIVSFAFQESELAFSAADSEPIFNSPEVRGGSACSSSPSTNQSPGDSDFKQTLTLTTNGTYGNVRRDSQIAANGEKKAKSSWRKSFQKGLGKKRGEESPSSVEEKNSGKKSKGVLHKMRKTMLMGGSPSKKKGKLINSNNSNEPSQYAWLQATLRSVASNQASSLGCKDAETSKAFTPLFFVIGSCPNYFCGMQVIAYFISSNGDGEVDFWWVKPVKGSDSQVEHATLCRQAKGPHKNDPGRSKQFYKPLADMFSQGHVAKDGRVFSIQAPPGETCPRAFIEEDSVTAGKRDRLWLHLVWQEAWTTNPWASSKYIKGKIVYQRNPKEIEFFSREYCIKDGVFTFSNWEDDPFDTILPNQSIKELYEGAT